MRLCVGVLRRSKREYSRSWILSKARKTVTSIPDEITIPGYLAIGLILQLWDPAHRIDV